MSNNNATDRVHKTRNNTMDKDYSIIYLANMRVPTEKAHGVQIFKMCEAFSLLGIKLELVTPFRFNNQQNNKSLKDFYDLKLEIKTTKIPALDLIFLGKMEIIFYFLHLITFALSFMFYILRRGGQVNLIFTRDVNLFQLIAPGIRLMLPNIKFALEIHSIPEIPWRRKRFFKIISKADFVITVTESMKQIIQAEDKELGGKIGVFHDAVDLERFHSELSKSDAREKLGLPKDKIILSFIGKFHTNGKEKGILDIIKSSRFRGELEKNIYYLFVGGPQERIDLYKKEIEVQRLNKDNFLFLDKRPLCEVPLYLWASDILLMPHPDEYFYKFCVSPLKLFEYMASGRPIIASDIPSIREVLIHQKNSYLVNPSDPKSLSKAVSYLIKNCDEALELAKKAKEDVLNFTWKKRAQGILNFVEAN